jgi:hypothetical protein
MQAKRLGQRLASLASLQTWPTQALSHIAPAPSRRTCIRALHRKVGSCPHLDNFACYPRRAAAGQI